MNKGRRAGNLGGKEKIWTRLIWPYLQMPNEKVMAFKPRTLFKGAENITSKVLDLIFQPQIFDFSSAAEGEMWYVLLYGEKQLILTDSAAKPRGKQISEYLGRFFCSNNI
ncbi:unnamed protein product [Kuraishia capsulata CBS 1993]|uniref:Uncharacterized protein n=1 Tax=Kuraishia capsulata CBS 1993 TaxID=1382522 RepID=W6MJE6_9ASCO|nr:uncharacterized protein KUCA_T00000513001 [Kuraishia capsulata CBS 1993]CDK24547.1 unnamed protein product [Kuraishia capsulata CBS 1993]